MDSNNIKITPKWNKSKEQIWAERFDALEDIHRLRQSENNRWVLYAAAAVVVVILSLPIYAFFHTTDVVVGRGEYLSVVLPDGSKVTLNSDSKLRIKPYWWSISREVELMGEAFFEVTKGSRFAIKTSNGLVTVLGTSFNVFSRESQFKVFCMTGRVEVASGDESTILTPNKQVVLQGNQLVASTSSNPAMSIGWTKGMFYFENTPLSDVVREIERQYNITVDCPKDLDYYYTGNFSREKNPQEVLQIIGKPFGLTLTIK